jgi:N-acetylmuramoyl-L-alanine amidase
MRTLHRLPHTSDKTLAKGLSVAFLAYLLGACTVKNPSLEILRESPLLQPNALSEFVPSDNLDLRKPSLIVLHHTEMASFEAALKTLQTQNPLGRVSAHYLIGRDGRIAQLVPDGARAWHAGVSRWNGRADLNSSSIGIELDNDGQSAFPDVQVQALSALLQDLCQRLGIDKTQVIAHSDVAPERKRDPSEFFPWETLAKAGFGRWPRQRFEELPQASPHFDPWLALALIGYDLSNRGATAAAFRRHFFAAVSDTRTSFDAIELAVLADLQAQILEGQKPALP